MPYERHRSRDRRRTDVKDEASSARRRYRYRSPSANRTPRKVARFHHGHSPIRHSWHRRSPNRYKPDRRSDPSYSGNRHSFRRSSRSRRNSKNFDRDDRSDRYIYRRRGSRGLSSSSSEGSIDYKKRDHKLKLGSLLPSEHKKTHTSEASDTDHGTPVKSLIDSLKVEGTEGKACEISLNQEPTDELTNTIIVGGDLDDIPLPPSEDNLHDVKPEREKIRFSLKAGRTISRTSLMSSRCSLMSMSCDEYSPSIDVRLTPKDPRISPKNERSLNRLSVPGVTDWGTGHFSDYVVASMIGEGTYGEVYKAKCKETDRCVALKKIRRDRNQEGLPKNAIREIKILRILDHKNIIKLLNIVTETRQESPDLESTYLVFEYMEHDLRGLLDFGDVFFTEQQIASFFKQLLMAIEYCHSSNFLHRDIKSSNILLNNRGQIKLADFGLSRLYEKDVVNRYTNRVITLWYRPPELLLGEDKYGPEVDIWSIGCILGEMYAKKPIFKGNNEMEQIMLIYKNCGTPTKEDWPKCRSLRWYDIFKPKQRYSRELKKNFSFIFPPAFDLMDRLLQLNPEKRPSASSALEHFWIAPIDPDKIPPPILPTTQDCHELWGKKMRREREHASKRHSETSTDKSEMSYQPDTPHVLRPSTVPAQEDGITAWIAKQALARDKEKYSKCDQEDSRIKGEGLEIEI